MKLDDLATRLRLTRLPEAETPDDWSQGVPLVYMREILDYWRDDYDWLRAEDRLNEFDQFKTDLDGIDIHFIHARSEHDDALPLIMTHGWPGSVAEFLKVIEPLRNPTAYGGTPEDAFHLVCPSLPGFGFSGKPTKTGWGVEKIGLEWTNLMAKLGYNAYVAQGGDWGSFITCAIADQDPEHCRGIHLTMPMVSPDPDTMEHLTEREETAVTAFQHYREWDSGYARQQATRPQTLGYGLVDSPIGQAAWILEKFWAWMDCDGHPENVLSRDELLDNIMIYWLTASGASSARIYWESLPADNTYQVNVPTGISQFPKEIFPTSKRWAEKRFTNIIHYNELEQGGHFAAMEQPQLLVEEIRNSFRHLHT